MNTKIVPGPGCVELNRGYSGVYRNRLLRTIAQKADDHIRGWKWIQERRVAGWQTIMTFAPVLPPKEE